MPQARTSGRHLRERPGQTDAASVTQGLKLPLTESSLRVEVWIEEPEEVDLEYWVQRRQAGMGTCSVMVNLEHQPWLGELTER